MVTPNPEHGVTSGSQNRLASRWVCGSMNPGSEHQVRGHRPRRADPGHPGAHGRDQPVPYGHIATEGRSPAPVHDGGVPYHQVVLGPRHDQPLDAHGAHGVGGVVVVPEHHDLGSLTATPSCSRQLPRCNPSGRTPAMAPADSDRSDASRRALIEIPGDRPTPGSERGSEEGTPAPCRWPGARPGRPAPVPPPPAGSVAEMWGWPARLAASSASSALVPGRRPRPVAGEPLQGEPGDHHPLQQHQVERDAGDLPRGEARP